MCGICGKVNFGRPGSIDETLIGKMADIMQYRGPDDKGIYLFPSSPQGSNTETAVGLGHRRLSIIDLSSSARQPISNEDKKIWVVCNGEIYNFLDLRKELEGKGHIFKSNSDAEVILHLYEEKGIDCVKELRGMFAFALWDENKQKLFLSRDRIGKKPLNYALKNKSLIFASEIKSILEDPQITKDIDSEAINLYLTYGYIPSPRTIFSGIKKLPPAHILTWEKGEVKIERYWRAAYKNKINPTENECCVKILNLLSEATRIRLMSDVPLGVLLSGGIDSSAVVAIASRISGRRIKTFSVGFEEKSFNELKYARRIAGLFNTEHREYVIKADILKILPKLVWHFNEPFADSSAIPTYYISQMARQEVTVALNGDGGDESFAGYQRYAAARLATIYGFIPRYLGKNIIRASINKFPESTRKKDLVRNLKRFVNADEFSPQRRHASWMSIFNNDLKEELYSREFKSRINDIDSWGYIQDAYQESDAVNFIDSTIFVDTITYLPGDLLVKADIASMANSLEGRSPFLDQELMEYAASLPVNLKLRGLATKYILKKALKGILPREVLYRPKQGFGVPVGSWLRDELKNYARDILLSLEAIGRGYFKEEAVKKILQEHALGKIDHGQRIWSLLNLELWHRIFIDSRK